MREQTITSKFWLTFNSRGSVKATKGRPSMDVNERAMQCEVTLPASLFTRPQLKATIEVLPIETEVPEINIEAAETALAGVLGTDVVLEVVQQPGDDED